MTVLEAASGAEAIEAFACFGGDCAVLVNGYGPAGSAQEAAARARRRMLGWHEQFSRFDPASELCRVNASPGETVPVSPVMARFVAAAVDAAARTGGLVDPTLVTEIERAGYAGQRDGVSVPLVSALRLAPARASGAPSRRLGWREVSVDRVAGTLTRPPGVRLDSGGIAKRLVGDVLASVLSRHASFAINAAGDVRFGGAAGLARPVQVASPFDDSVLHVFEFVRGAVATSGIGKRSWLDPEGRPAHHLLNPATGRPAFTGIVQVTAIAPSAIEAEALAKAALLSGPDHVERWLRHGGLVVYDDGSFDVIDPHEPIDECHAMRSNPHAGLRSLQVRAMR